VSHTQRGPLGEFAGDCARDRLPPAPPSPRSDESWTATSQPFLASIRKRVPLRRTRRPVAGTRRLGQLRVRASGRQAERLLEWAGGWPRRTWAIEGARGLGLLLAQQLIAAGAHVLDVPPRLAARVRLLDTGQINKNDDNRQR
jgi:hypothetical protein